MLLKLYVLGFHSLHTCTLIKTVVLLAHKQKERYRASMCRREDNGATAEHEEVFFWPPFSSHIRTLQDYRSLHPQTERTIPAKYVKSLREWEGDR